MTIPWRKSSRSEGSQDGGCVELAALHGQVGFRDSKNPHVAELLCSRQHAAELFTAIRSGTYDR